MFVPFTDEVDEEALYKWVQKLCSEYYVHAPMAARMRYVARFNLRDDIGIEALRKLIAGTAIDDALSLVPAGDFQYKNETISAPVTQPCPETVALRTI